jgi:uncharacterized membrane protein YkoI
MKKNGYFVKSIVALSLIGTLAMADSVKESNDDEKNLQIKSSIQISDNATEEIENSSAKIGVDDVVKVVKEKFLGTIISTKLENENGNLVYVVEVLDKNQITDVIVDAGNGEILAQKVDTKDSHDKDDNDDEEHDEENETWYKFWK